MADKLSNALKRQQRLALELRENLKRRKAQARARAHKPEPGAQPRQRNG